MPGQYCAGEIVKAPCTRLAAIPLPSALRVVTPVPDHHGAVTPGTAHAIGPAMLAHQREALGVVQKTREVDQIGRSHDDEGSSREPDGCSCSSHHTRCPASTLLKPTTPEANKSLAGLRVLWTGFPANCSGVPAVIPLSRPGRDGDRDA